MAKERIGELLVRENLISPVQLHHAQTQQNRDGGRLAYHLVKQGFIEDTELTAFLSKHYGVPSVNLDDFHIEESVITLISEDIARKHLVVPINRIGSSLVVAMSDPSNIYAIDELKFITGFNIEVVVASEVAIREAIEIYYAEQLNVEDIIADMDFGEVEVVEEEEALDIVDLTKNADEAPVIRLVNLILLDAIKRNTSDIHIEPYEKSFRVRYRIDGVLYEVMNPPLKLKDAITSRVKIMSNLDIAERRLPQDGRIKLKLGGGKEMDFRVSICPTLFGEKAVLRLLDKSNLQLDMTKLGFEPAPLHHFKDAIHRPYGMVLVTGPTGSGKTTTLYSALAELNKTSENISTAEDPVEFNLAGINQVQMNEAVGLNFAAALRSFLRQDPDIIMVGEIRDFETAEIAVKAALTGHMVLSTLHTNDAPGTISRLLNMGVEPFLVTASVNLVLAQRLARKVCSECATDTPVPEQTLIDLQVREDMLRTLVPKEGSGVAPNGGECRRCGGTGFKGRVALYEVMVMGEELKEAVLQGYSTAELKHEARRLGMQTLREAGINKLNAGVIPVSEVVRCSAPD
ncbi:MAG: type IV-A pilus assembly ATPase PilB [Myxococcota bacterium]